MAKRDMRHERRARAYLRISQILEALEDEEVLVVEQLAARLLAGQVQYGPLRKSNTRDWRKERGEEIQDLLIYSAFEELKALIAQAKKRETTKKR